MVQILCQMLPQFSFPLSGHRGKEEDLFWVPDPQRCRRDLATPTPDAPAYLIDLRQDHQMRYPRRGKPRPQLLIQGGGGMACVHDHDHGPDDLSASQISFDHRAPRTPDPL